jgi:hypothetical protein
MIKNDCGSRFRSEVIGTISRLATIRNIPRTPIFSFVIFIMRTTHQQRALRRRACIFGERAIATLYPTRSLGRLFGYRLLCSVCSVLSYSHPVCCFYFRRWAFMRIACLSILAFGLFAVKDGLVCASLLVDQGDLAWAVGAVECFFRWQLHSFPSVRQKKHSSLSGKILFCA